MKRLNWDMDDDAARAISGRHRIFRRRALRLAVAILALPTVLSALPLNAVSSKSIPVGRSSEVQWACSPAMLPAYKTKVNSPDVGEGVSYLYVGGKHQRVRQTYADEKYLRSDYGADARFMQPLDQRRGWYDSAVRLSPMNENDASVQIEISRWERFGYKEHAAVAWAVPHGDVEYRDLNLMLDDQVPHRLGIYVHADTLRLFVDGRVVCSTQASYFTSPSAPKYFQVRTETSVVGSNGGASVSDLRLKRDVDAKVRPYRTDCILHRHGVFWQYLGGGKFSARGAFDRNGPTFFTGIDVNKRCRT